MTRKHFLISLAAIAGSTLAADGAAPRRILLRSSWQTVNIGDIAHTPGVLHLLEQHLPDAEIRLWPSSVDNGVAEMLMARFPKLVIVKGPDALKAAFAECDFLLHSSGPSLVAEKDVARWSKETGKPYGVYGITVGAMKDSTREVLNGAKFVYFRDSVSLAFAKANGVTAPIMEFSPDGAFAVDLADDAKASAFLAKHQLEDGKFLCCIGRLRNTPYWEIRNKPMTEEDERKKAVNNQLKEHDHAELRNAIIAVVRQTKLKILICPEDESQMAVGKEMLFDPLPQDVKDRVVWREHYWLTNEALSTYRRSAGLFGNEMHSPIMCIGNGIPAIVCRWKQQTSKGFMWKDIGLGEWLFDMDDESQLPGIVPAVLAMAKDPEFAKAKAVKARGFVRARQKETMAVVSSSTKPSP